MNEKKKSITKQKPEHVIRCGQVTAMIYLRQSNSGLLYRQFSLGRSWSSMATGKEAHGTTFFHDNQEDLIQAVQQASEWIRHKIAGALPDDRTHTESNVAS